MMEQLFRKNQVTATAEKEDDTDSTATVATVAFTSICESEWDDDITEQLAGTTTLNNQIYIFGKRRQVKPARKWGTPTSQVCMQRRKKQSKFDTTGNKTSTNNERRPHVW